MLSEVQTKSANYLRIIAVLKALRERGYINDKEYARAKKYYRKLTGADIVTVSYTHLTLPTICSV